MASPSRLSPQQANALFNILSHHETYTEIESFKYSKAIAEYGPPFQAGPDTKSGSPILQTLLTHLLLPLPGLKDVSPSFWPERVLPFISALSSANLSESYDKGILGQRKTLATAISAILECPARGYFGGLAKQKLQKESGNYNTSSPEDGADAWHDLLQQVVYGNAIDEIFTRATETENLQEHSSLVQTAHKFIVLNLASFLHYTVIVSPKGPALLTLLESAHKLVPYTIIRQTLRVGNAATMISAMVKVVLAKASVGTVTNWLGISHGADEGMNLMQTIISTVLGWDIRKLKGRASQIEKSKGALSKEQLNALSDYVKKSQEEQEGYRLQSKTQSRSIVSIILSESDTSELSASNHTIGLEYLSIILSIRDREQLIAIFCRHNPDLLTPIARDLVSAYEPIIRAIHNAVDLSGTVSDAERFIDDFIRVSKTKSSEANRATVEDYVALLEQHQSSSHRFIHQVTKNGKEITEWYREYAHEVARQFRQSSNKDTSRVEPDAGAVTEDLNSLVHSLSSSDQATITKELDKHAEYLSSLSSSSTTRSIAVLSNKSTSHGPGMYLARWQALLDGTEITPAEAKGKVRTGASTDVRDAARVDVDGKKKGDEGVEKDVEKQLPSAPSTAKTVRLLDDKFWEMLRSWRGRSGLDEV